MTATRTDETYTSYAAASVVNNILEELGIDKHLPPQMFYNYGKSSRIPTVTVDGKTVITNDDLFVWVEKYLNKNHKVSLSDLAIENEDLENEEDLETEKDLEEVTVS